MPRTDQARDTFPSASRRLCARVFDYGAFASLIQFLLSATHVHSTWRILSLEHEWLLQTGTVALWIPVESVLLAVFQTTPGKWLCGIYVTDCDGRPLRVRAALDRSLSVFVFGLAGWIPMASLVALVWGYRDITERGAAQWDRNRYLVKSKPLAREWRWMIGVGLTAVLIVYVAMSAFGG